MILDDYGYKVENGNIGGLHGLIMRGEIDFGTSAIFMREDRLLTMDFTGDIYNMRCDIRF